MSFGKSAKSLKFGTAILRLAEKLPNRQGLLTIFILSEP